MTSRDLLHFTNGDLPTVSSRERDREEIEKQTQEYLKRSKIKHVDHTANKTWGQPLKLSKQDQINTMKRRRR